MLKGRSAALIVAGLTLVTIGIISSGALSYVLLVAAVVVLLYAAMLARKSGGRSPSAD